MNLLNVGFWVLFRNIFLKHNAFVWIPKGDIKVISNI